ncbi:MAG: CotH kinase family protein [Alicyclobacillus sp.]|nr:CotH kinase family protein [Alicyclobacillus sp.]
MDLQVVRLTLLPEDWQRLQADKLPSWAAAEWSHHGQRERVWVRLRGNRTRYKPKKSYDIRTCARTFHLNAEYDDPALLRSALAFWLFEQLGVACPRTQPCWLQVNGQDHGVYLAIEGVDAAFFRLRHRRCQGLFYAVNHNAHFGLFTTSGRLKHHLLSGYEQVLGKLAERQRLQRFLFDLNTLQGASLQRFLAKSLDVPQYLAWLTGVVCTSHADGLTQNYALYTCRELPRYRIMPWDCEGTWGRNCYGEPCPADVVPARGDNVLTRRLLSVPTWRSAYWQTLRQAVHHWLREDVILPIAAAWLQRVVPALMADPARPRRPDLVASELATLRQYLAERRQYLLSALPAADPTTGQPQRAGA